jgi:hypothetical protein
VCCIACELAGARDVKLDACEGAGRDRANEQTCEHGTAEHVIRNSKGNAVGGACAAGSAGDGARGDRAAVRWSAPVERRRWG